MPTDIEKIIPPEGISSEQKKLVFALFHRRLAHYCKTVKWYSNSDPSLNDGNNADRQTAFKSQIDFWAQSLLSEAWIVCHGGDNGTNGLTTVIAIITILILLYFRGLPYVRLACRYNSWGSARSKCNVRHAQPSEYNRLSRYHDFKTIFGLYSCISQDPWKIG